MENKKTPIVIAAYNRANSLDRLLKSLSNAIYPSNDIDLIISIDYANNNSDVLTIAEAFDWAFGDKKVMYQPYNLGLRKHIIQCVSLCNTYGSIILLEDDLFLSPHFYAFSQQALNFCDDKDYISGISLYNHQYHQSSQNNFSPIEDGYDNWYLQYAFSSGIAINKAQWNSFLIWYKENEVLRHTSTVPKNVTQWSDKSWLKYYIHYLVQTNKFFFYPKISLTCNFNDAGTHILKDSTLFQVPLSQSVFNIKYFFSEITDSSAIYDVYFENTQLNKALNLAMEDVVIDLYGIKPINQSSRYMLTDRILPYKIIKSFGRFLKPHDANILNNVIGSDFFLYDLQKKADGPPKPSDYAKIMYKVKQISRREAAIVWIQLFKEALHRKLKILGL